MDVGWWVIVVDDWVDGGDEDVGFFFIVRYDNNDFGSWYFVKYLFNVFFFFKLMCDNLVDVEKLGES